MKYRAIANISFSFFLSFNFSLVTYASEQLKTREKLGYACVGVSFCTTGAFCFYKARPHINNALYYSGGVDYFLTSDNWWPLLKACWAVSGFGKGVAFAADTVMPYWAEGNLFSVNSLYESYNRICIAQACCNACPWISSGITCSGYGLRMISKSLTTTKKQSIK